MEIITTSAEDTQKLGEKIGSSLKGGEIIALSGDLGSGKTTFMQGLGRALGLERIISPTFIIMRSYVVNHLSAQAGQTSTINHLFHLDLYRLEKNADKELQALGIEDFWNRPDNIVVIEWAEYAKAFLPANTKWIMFENISETQRRITYEPFY